MSTHAPALCCVVAPQGVQSLTSEGVLMGLLGLLGERHLGALQAWPGAGGGGRQGAALLIINAIDVLQVSCPSYRLGLHTREERNAAHPCCSKAVCCTQISAHRQCTWMQQASASAASHNCGKSMLWICTWPVCYTSILSNTTVSKALQVLLHIHESLSLLIPKRLHSSRSPPCQVARGLRPTRTVKH